MGKQMENQVKWTGMMGGGKNEPTVIQPRMYKQRFPHAMKKYFLVLPSKPTPWVLLRQNLKTIVDDRLRHFLCRITFDFFDTRSKLAGRATKRPVSSTPPPAPPPRDRISSLL